MKRLTPVQQAVGHSVALLNALIGVQDEDAILVCAEPGHRWPGP
ncbi:MAG: hypothetical protein ACETWB_04295 [Anaerolineae bacterium]